MIAYESYKLVIEKRAQKFLEGLDKHDHEKIASKIKELTSLKFQQLDIKKLQGYKHFYRLRINDYRVIFTIVEEKKIILITLIRHRKEVYDIAKRISF